VASAAVIATLMSTLSLPFQTLTPFIYLWFWLSLSLLPRYSDLIVNATYQYAQPNQTAPSWVSTLPEPERSEKLKMIRQYGVGFLHQHFVIRGAWSE
jgi:hypothetical protein